MWYPQLSTTTKQRNMISVFGGYNHAARIGDEEFYDMQNMTSDYYPVLSPRKPRGVYASPAATSGIIAKDAVCYVDGTEFVIGEYRVEMGLDEQPKSLISMGAYVIIMPDRKYINTLDLTDFGSIEAAVTTENPVTFNLCRLTGEAYATEYIQATEPEDPENMALWVDTSSEPHVLKQWSESSELWVSIATTYIKITSAGIGAAFSQHDGVTISGLDGELHANGSEDVINSAQLAALNGSAVIWAKGENYIVVAGILDRTVTISDQVTIERKMPNMDFIVEAGNRLWGCRYGLAANGEVVNEIYASKLGDFRNWNCYMGISTDSYAASCGTDGPFTGAITHLGYPLFFKENCLHKVYGDYPSNFRIQNTACRGVQKGCGKSLAIVNETLYYKGRNGVCAYDGSLPVEVSPQFGEIRYSDAVAGAHGNKYYISHKDQSGSYSLFVFDTAKGLWHKEDGLRADGFASCDGELYAIEHDSKKIIAMLGSGTVDTERVKWMVETGPIGLSSPDMKYISLLTVRMSLDAGSTARMAVQYDFSQAWEELPTIGSTHLRSFPIPIRPKRCDTMRLRIQGEGGAKILSITKTIEQGSDIS